MRLSRVAQFKEVLSPAPLAPCAGAQRAEQRKHGATLNDGTVARLGAGTFSTAGRLGFWRARLFCAGYRLAQALLPTGSNLDWGGR